MAILDFYTDYLISITLKVLKIITNSRNASILSAKQLSMYV